MKVDLLRTLEKASETRLDAISKSIETNVLLNTKQMIGGLERATN